jgi:hypothetical protein
MYVGRRLRHLLKMNDATFFTRTGTSVLGNERCSLAWMFGVGSWRWKYIESMTEGSAAYCTSPSFQTCFCWACLSLLICFRTSSLTFYENSHVSAGSVTLMQKQCNYRVGSRDRHEFRAKPCTFPSASSHSPVIPRCVIFGY